MAVEVHVAALEQRVLVILLAGTGFAQDLLVVGVLLEAEEAGGGAHDAVFHDRRTAHGADFARTATHGLQRLTHEEDVVVGEAVGGHEFVLVRLAAADEEILGTALEDEGHAGASRLFATHPAAELLDKAGTEFVDHAHLLVHALRAGRGVAQVVGDHLVGVDYCLLEVVLIVEEGVTRFAATVEAGEGSDAEGETLAYRRVVDDLDGTVLGFALEHCPEVVGLLKHINGLLPDDADRIGRHRGERQTCIRSAEFKTHESGGLLIGMPVAYRRGRM